MGQINMLFMRICGVRAHAPPCYGGARRSSLYRTCRRKRRRERDVTAIAHSRKRDRPASGIPADRDAWSSGRCNVEGRDDRRSVPCLAAFQREAQAVASSPAVVVRSSAKFSSLIANARLSPGLDMRPSPSPARGFRVNGIGETGPNASPCCRRRWTASRR